MAQQPESAGWISAAEVLRAVLPKVVSTERLQEARVWEVWEAAVGRVVARKELGKRFDSLGPGEEAAIGRLVARKAQPSKIQRGKLFVTVGNSVSLQELHFYKADIRAELNQRLGASVVKDIFFVLGRVQDVATRPLPPPSRPLPPFSELQVPKLNHPELEAAFASLLHARRRRLKEKRRG